MGIKSYSSTAASNVNVSGVAGTEIDENDDPGAINNAIRQILADMASDLVSGGDFVWELASGGALVRVGLDAPFDGVKASYEMSSLLDGAPVTVGGSAQIRVFVGGARQEPDVHYSAVGTTFNFFAPPLASDEFFALAAVGEIVTPADPEYRLFEDDFEHMFAQEDPDNPGEEIDLGLHLLEINTP